MKNIFSFLAILIFSIASKAQSTVGLPCTDLFISQYISPQGSGTSGNKSVEIFNPFSAPINLSGYLLKEISNGNCGTISTFHFPNKYLAAGDVYVINNGSGTVNSAIIAVRDTTWGTLNFTGNDALFLINPAGDTLDVFGQLCVNPGTAWHLGNDSTRYETLVRKSTVHNGQRNFATWQTEWMAYASNSYSYLGSHTMIPCSTLNPVANFSIIAQNVNDSAATILMGVNLNTACPNAVTVDVQVFGGNAILGNDFTFSNQTLTFPANSTAAEFATISIVKDTVAPFIKTILLKLSNPTNGAVLGADSVETITIINRDSTKIIPTVSFNNSIVSDSENVGTIAIPFTIQHPLANATHLYFSLSGTCTLGSDFTMNTNNPIALAANSSSGNISLNISDDNLVEGNETIVIKLDSIIGGKVGTNAQLTLTVIDNDASGIEKIDAQSNIHLFPNPMTMNGEINFINLPKTINSIELYNLLGMKICAEKIAENKFNLNNKVFQKGIYFYKINNANGDLLKAGKLMVE